MALTGKTAYRLGGDTIADEDIDNDANIEISKLATRTLRFTIPATAFHLEGTGCVMGGVGDFGYIVMPNANFSIVYVTIPKPCEYTSDDITVRILWASAGTSGNLKLAFTYRGITAGSVDNLGEASTSNTDATNGSANTLNEMTLTITAANIVSSNSIEMWFERDPADGSDTLSSDIKVFAMSLEFTGRG
jgi:hypothetical protein